MSWIAGVVVRVLPGTARTIEQRLAEVPAIEIADCTDDGVAIVVTADTPSQQEQLHEQLRAWPGVLEVVLTFQSEAEPVGSEEDR